MKYRMTGIWEEMAAAYREMGLSEEEIAERIICKTTRLIDGTNNLEECDEK